MFNSTLFYSFFFFKNIFNFIKKNKFYINFFKINNFLILKNKNNSFFFLKLLNFFFVIKSSFFFFKLESSLYIKNIIIKYSTIFYKFITKFFNFFFILNEFNFYTKVSFKGKFFKFDINTVQNSLLLNFGHSFDLCFFFNFLKVVEVNKNLFIFIFKNVFKSISLFSKIINRRPYSIYTSRGLRYKNQLIFKKIGKISGNF